MVILNNEFSVCLEDSFRSVIFRSTAFMLYFFESTTHSCETYISYLFFSPKMTLIARRSSEFAGVRFLKRGVNAAGYVGNDVETEQIVADLVATGSAASAPPLASFVQLRGSIPLFWSQEGNVFEPKPDINICRVDPFYAATARHFASLMRRYGAPIVVLNLIKQQEKRPRESKLSAEFDAAMLYLNSTLPPHAHLQYFCVCLFCLCVCAGLYFSYIIVW